MEATLNMLSQFAMIAGQAAIPLLEVSHELDRRMGAEHGQVRHQPDPPIDSAIAASGNAPERSALMTDDIHSCSYYCDRPECIKAQRDELRDRILPASEAADGDRPT
jgi:hypothetical protein